MAKKRIPQGIIGYGSSLDQFSFERLATLPSTNNFGGRLVQLTTDGLIYKRNEANSAWDVIGSPTGVIKADGTVPFTADQSMGGNQLTNVGSPIENEDAATLGSINDRVYRVILADIDDWRSPSELIPGFVVDNIVLVANTTVLITSGSSAGIYRVNSTGPATLINNNAFFVFVYTGLNFGRQYFGRWEGYPIVYSLLPTTISAMTTKSVPVDNDAIAISDSNNDSKYKKLTILNLKNYLNGFFQQISAKNAASGYVGLTATFQLQLKNLANTFTSLLQNSNTAIRTYTLQDRNGTLADDTDITGAKSRANHTGTQPSSTISDFNTAVDARVALGTVGLFDYRGNYDASVGTFPTTGGSGSAGAILKGDVFRISVAGTMGGVAYKIGDHALALVDSPAQTASNWGSWINDEGSGSLVAKSTPTLIGNGSLTVIPVTHNLGTKNVKAIVRKVSDDTIWDIDPTATSTNIANLDFGAYVPTTNEFEVVIIA